jgi:hypothetical protein
LLQNPEVTVARADNSFGTNFENSPEPIYGHHFLPRKFKIAVTVPGDNSVDLFTNDLGVVVLCNDAGELMVFPNLVSPTDLLLFFHAVKSDSCSNGNFVVELFAIFHQVPCTLTSSR